MDSPAKQKKLAIIDPGLMSASGHHAALAELVASGLLGKGWQVTYICHRLISDKIKASLQEAGCQVVDSFDLNFYANFNQPVTIPDIQPYLRQAVREYQSALAYISQSEEAVICFHPSINWDHALVLALALAAQNNAQLTHLCCAMFDPGIDTQGKALDMGLELNARIAFKALAEFANVEIQASDDELSRKYARLLNRSVPVHPCYLANWEAEKIKTPHREEETSGTRRITLYLGEAKEDKGFCRLPALVRHLLDTLPANDEIYIQYTLAWPDAVVEAAIKELQQITQSDTRVLVENGFLSDEQFHQRLKATSIFVVTYDQQAYAQKNSGILYFLVWYAIPTVFMAETWLSREAKRLELAMVVVQPGITLGDAVKRLAEQGSTQSQRASQYREIVFQPMREWLESKAYSNKAFGLAQ